MFLLQNRPGFVIIRTRGFIEEQVSLKNGGLSNKAADKLLLQNAVWTN